MIFSMLRQHQARSAILRFISKVSTCNVDFIFKPTYSNQTQSINQAIVFQQVSINITADGCAL